MINAVTSGPTFAVVEPPATCASHASGLSPEEQLLTLLVFSEVSRSDAAKGSINLSSEQLNTLREQAQKALAAARKAQDHSGFWGMISNLLSGDIASLAKVVAMAAAAVATGGTAALVLGAIAVGATLAAKYADKLGIPPNVAIGLGVAAGLAAVASGNVGGGISQFTSLGQAANATRLLYEGVAVTATAGGAASHGIAGYYQGQALDFQADTKQLDNEQVLESANIDANLENLQAALERQLAGVRVTTQLVERDHQNAQQVIHDFSGAA